ncbi:MAG: DUF6328 family protein [Solirubrobacteraceae bacterium]
MPAVPDQDRTQWRRLSESGRDETEVERADRNLNELLGELRVALPGVQVLFAFLLTVPFTQRFARVTDFQEKVYFGTLLCAAAASALLIAPTAHHRIQFRLQDKDHLVLVANRLALAGLAALAVSMTGVVLLVTDVLFATPTTVIATVLAATAFITLWFVLPVRRRVHLRRRRSARRPSSSPPAGS